ncbi:MAG TPA: hypothetical protein VKV15_19940, partial [Bryobacteraceae bacterium]|nr:hypothetical protein [Bryobacteraceae bacterium]
MNAVTQSGSNNYHGAAYNYSRITGLVAHDRYAMGQSLLHRQNQAGASVGGPILHDKLFFFANFELLDGHFDGLNRISNPLIADGTGTQVLASNCTATAAQCAAASKFLQLQMNVLTPFSDRRLSGLAKINYRRSDRNTVALEANAMNSHAPDGTQLGLVAPNGGLLGLQNSSDHTRYGKAEWTSAPSAKSVNELCFGIFEDRWDDPASLANAATGNVAVSIAGTTVGASHPDASLLSEHRYELVDNLTFTAGSHTLRFGGDLSKTRDWLDGLNDATGTYVYPSLTAFAQDFGNTGTIRSYTSFGQQLGNPIGALSAKEADLYAQDTWRPFQRLLVTAGVRWEKPFYPQPPAANTTYYQTGVITSPDINFAPRMGLAYQLNNRTVIRAGYGWFYAPLPGELLDALYLGNGETVTSITVNPTQANAPVFPKTFASGSVIPSGTQNLIYASNKLRDPRTQQATLALERRLNKDTTLTLSVLNSRGLKFWSATDTNLATPSKTETYTIDNASGQKVGSFTTQLWTGKNDATKAHIYEIENSGSSTYNALALQLRKQISYGLSVQASYTWSHAIDDVSGPAIAGFVPLNTYDSNLQFDRGNSATDQRHRVAIDWMWQPTVKSDWAAARYLLNGWGISGIGTLASAEPVTPVVVVSGQQFSTITMDYTNSLNGSGGWARVPFEGINSLMTAPQYNVDVRVARTLPFTERVKGVLMFDVFNIFNTQNTTDVNTIAYQAVTSLPVGVVSGPYSGILKP